MPDHEARGRAVYDHDNDEPRSTGRRRRPAADWGVGEEIFDHMPRRRFAREESNRRPGHEIPRGGADDGRRTIVIGEDDDHLPPPTKPAQRKQTTEEFASREEAIRAREEHDAVWAGDEPFAPEPADFDEPEPADADDGDDLAGPRGGERDETLARGYDSAVRDEGGALARDSAVARSGARGGDEGAATRQPEMIADRRVEGRRTVKIGGRPGEFATPARRRPPRTVSERVGHRPARFAAWAFALGLLLIFIAVATAVAGT